MNTKVWYLSYFKGVYYTRMIETYPNLNASIVRMVHRKQSTQIFTIVMPYFMVVSKPHENMVKKPIMTQIIVIYHYKPKSLQHSQNPQLGVGTSRD